MKFKLIASNYSTKLLIFAFYSVCFLASRQK